MAEWVELTGGAEPLRVKPDAKMDAAGEWQMTKCNEGDPIRGGGNEGPETGGGSRTGAGESAHQAASGGTTTTWVHATHDPTLSNLPKYPFTVQSTSWTLQPLGRVSKHFIKQPRKLTGTVCTAPPNAALQRRKGK